VSDLPVTTVYRDKVTGKKIDIASERLKKQKEELEKEEELAKYMEWGKGLVQKREKERLIQEQEQERDRPFAVARDNPELNEALKKKARWGDPLVNLSISSDSMKEEKVVSDSGKRIRYVRPTYRGPPPPPNRFGIAPGYRWDGVDRSNGYERRYFEAKASALATKKEAYQWSVEDM
jgi:pre-mRNA-splicing factor CWC26